MDATPILSLRIDDDTRARLEALAAQERGVGRGTRSEVARRALDIGLAVLESRARPRGREEEEARRRRAMGKAAWMCSVAAKLRTRLPKHGIPVRRLGQVSAHHGQADVTESSARAGAGSVSVRLGERETDHELRDHFAAACREIAAELGVAMRCEAPTRAVFDADGEGES